jgi:hypothetical protein
VSIVTTSWITWFSATVRTPKILVGSSFSAIWTESEIEMKYLSVNPENVSEMLIVSETLVFGELTVIDTDSVVVIDDDTDGDGDAML